MQHFSTPDRSQVVVANDKPPAVLTDPEVFTAYQQGYGHMLDSAWYAAIAGCPVAARLDDPHPKQKNHLVHPTHCCANRAV